MGNWGLQQPLLQFNQRKREEFVAMMDAQLLECPVSIGLDGPWEKDGDLLRSRRESNLSECARTPPVRGR